MFMAKIQTAYGQIVRKGVAFILLKLYLNLKYKFIKGDKEASEKMSKMLIEEENLKDHFDVGRFVNKKMTYKSDKLFGIIDTIQDLDYTVKSGYKGDCDDFSMLAYRLLEQLGYNPYLLTIIPLKFWKGHVVCLYKVKGYYYFISTNGNTAIGGFQQIRGIFDYLKYKYALTFSIDKI